MPNNDPFADVKLSEQVGLDQRLFQKKDDNETTKQRNNVATLSRRRETASVSTPVETPVRRDAATKQRSKRHAHHRSPASPRGSMPLPKGYREGTRIIERHSHDIFLDQIRWMNRLKLDLEERYGKRVTSNAIVQVALDLLRFDYEVVGEQSVTIRVLIRGEAFEATKERGSGEGDGATGYG